MMHHLKSSFTFKSSENIWTVEYYDDKCFVYLNGDIYHNFNDGIPNTRSSNPTKTQAKEIISFARKINKSSDKRELKIEKILK